MMNTTMQMGNSRKVDEKDSQAYHAASQILEYLRNANVTIEVRDYEVTFNLPGIDDVNPSRIFTFNRLRDFSEEKALANRIIQEASVRLSRL